jgi:hypothetical protein
MKKSFFLLPIAALAAIFSFSACSSGGDGPDGVFVMVACNVQITMVGSNCWELSGYFPESEVNEQIAEGEEYCQEYINLIKEELAGYPVAITGSVVDKCQPAFLECKYTEDGETIKFYFSEQIAMQSFGGKNCPKKEDLF